MWLAILNFKTIEDSLNKVKLYPTESCLFLLLSYMHPTCFDYPQIFLSFPSNFPSRLYVLFLNPLNPFRAACMCVGVGPPAGMWKAPQRPHP